MTGYNLTVLLLVSGLAGSAVSADLPGTTISLPPKIGAPSTGLALPTRTAGDTVADAIVIPTLPFEVAGSTVGYADDLDAECPYTTSSAPDVVYAFTASSAIALDIDLCGSSYDTKLYVLDEAGDLLGCNDDYYWEGPCGVFVSRIVNVGLLPAQVAFIVVDGFGDQAGEYTLSVREYEPCYVAPPTEAIDEGEPYLADGYVDNYNSGCFGASNTRFQSLSSASGRYVLYGRSGWYLCGAGDADRCRDSDWFTIVAGADGPIVATIESEQEIDLCQVLRWNPCLQPRAPARVTARPCTPATLTVAAAPQTLLCLMVIPTTFAAPDGAIGNEFDYVLTVEGLQHRETPTESSTWGRVKSLYR